MRKPLIVGYKGQDLFAVWREAPAAISDDSTKDSCRERGIKAIVIPPVIRVIRSSQCRI